MAKFTNDLSFELSMIQHEEILESINARYKRRNKELALKTGILTGAIVATSAIVIRGDNPEICVLTMASLSIANPVNNLFLQNRKLKSYKIDYNNLNNIDHRALAKAQRERDRYNGKLTHKHHIAMN